MKKLLITLVTFLMAVLCSKASVFLDNSTGRPVLKVEEQPFFILGGELGNSSATCVEDIDSIFPVLSDMGLNTVLVPVYWDLTEPEENKFDFSLTDRIISAAEKNQLKVIVLWFGAWKNSMSCYAPSWVKKDYDRFPRARCSSGKPLEIASPFSENVLQADLKAFLQLLNHIKENNKDNTVIMIQVENEIGMLEDARDHSELADSEYARGVPTELMQYLHENKESLHPSLLKKWGINGYRPSGTWKEVFGDDIFTDEYFMAWNYARYVDKLSENGKQILNIPFYLNAALNSRDRLPGEYPSAGPLAHLKDFWRAGASSIDFISPDIYDSGFEDWVAQYDLPDNVLFIPEVKRENENAAQVYYVAGHHNAIGFSPFSIENASAEYKACLKPAYQVVNQLTPVLSAHPGDKLRDGFMLTQEAQKKTITDDSVKITLSHYFTLPWDARARSGEPWPSAGAVLMKLAEGEYLLAGNGVVAKFEDVKEEQNEARLGEDGFLQGGEERLAGLKNGRTPRIGLASVEEVEIEKDGTIRRLRSLNGDETHQGRHARISIDDNKILLIKTYSYQ